MNLIVLTNSRVSLPALAFFKEQESLHGIYTSLPLSDDACELQHWADANGVPFMPVSREELDGCLLAFRSAYPDGPILTFGFPWKVAALRGAGYDHCYNIHFSLLPKYAGPIPVFWQLKCGDREGGVSLHRLSQRMDGGAIVAQLPVPVIAGENFGHYSARLAQSAVLLSAQLLDACRNKRHMPAKQQEQSGRTYFAKPREKDLLIDWEQQDSDSVENLVNACNPVAGGAWTWYGNRPMQILEVSPADGAIAAAPGTIVHAHPAQGIFVSCRDGKLLRINVARIPEGIYSGGRLAALGFAVNTRFSADPRAGATKASTFIHQ